MIRMLKNRLIPCLVLRDNIIVQSLGFKRYLPIGKAEIAIEFFMNWDVDEILVVDITATKEEREVNFDFIKYVSKKCFLPLTIGGGIKTVEDIRKVLKAGADKVSINTAAFNTPELIEKGAKTFGSQAIVISIDTKKNDQGEYKVYLNSGTEETDISPLEYAKKCEKLGAGEIFLTAIDRDGMKNGYDIELIKMVSDKVNIPVIACGGVGKMEHFAEGIQKGGASAVSAANIFQHIEQSTIVAKAFMKKQGVDVRLISKAKYDDFEFDEFGRILKSPKIEKTWWY